MPAKLAGGTAVAEQSAPDNTGNGAKEPNAFERSLLADAAEMGHTVADPRLLEKPETEETEVTDDSIAEVTDETREAAENEAQTEEETEQEQETEETQVESEHKSIDDQIEEFKAKGEKPPWYLTRIAEGTRKLKDRTSQLEKATTVAKGLVQENQQLKQQLTTASAPRDPATSASDAIPAASPMPPSPRCRTRCRPPCCTAGTATMAYRSAMPAWVSSAPA